MTLKDYICDLLVEERSLIEELLKVDNHICQTKLTYDVLYAKIYSVVDSNEVIEHKCNYITDGEPDNVLLALMNAPKIKNLHINRTYVGINKWLTERTKEYFKEQNINVNLILDIEKGYRRYTDDNHDIVIIGPKEFIYGIASMFIEKTIIKIER